MINITTHILDTSVGKPAEGMSVLLFFLTEDGWAEISRAISNPDGRITHFDLVDMELVTGIYKLRFETADYFAPQKLASFYPFVEIVFELTADQHYHVPLLLNPFGYTTYRGS